MTIDTFMNTSLIPTECMIESSELRGDLRLVAGLPEMTSILSRRGKIIWSRVLDQHLSDNEHFGPVIPANYRRG